MTALEYARENLFKPLGIQVSDWPADPQGYTRGWGDLALQPRDAAKLGYLWVNQGSWDGRQIVSREWVNASTRPYFSGTGRKENYGYAWWVSPAKEEPAYFLAAGRGGQRVQVLPGMNMIIVTTGGGFEFDQIEPFLAPTIVDLSRPLPANPAGVARLQAALTAITRGPAPQAVAPLPETARSISGKTFVFESNLKQIQSVRVEFGAAEATVELDLGNEENPRVMVVGLDGVFRASRGGRPIMARGEWSDDSMLRIQVDEGPGLNSYMLPLHFQGDRVSLEIAGLPSLEGRIVEQ